MSSSNPPPGEYVCHFCGTRFSTNIALSKHTCVRSQRTVFVCSTCKKAYSRKHDLNRHRRSHTGERPFTCCRCGRDFARKSTLVAHFATHFSFNNLLYTAIADENLTQADDVPSTTQTDQSTPGSSVTEDSRDLTRSASSSEIGTQRGRRRDPTKETCSEAQGSSLRSDSRLPNRPASNIKHRRTVSSTGFTSGQDHVIIPQGNLYSQCDQTFSFWMTRSEPNLVLAPADTCRVRRDPVLRSSGSRSGDSRSNVPQESLNTQSIQTAGDSNAGGDRCQQELSQELRGFVNQPPSSSVTRIVDNRSDIPPESNNQSDPTSSGSNVGGDRCQQESFEFRDFVNPPLPSSRPGSGDSLSDILQESLITQFDQTASDSNAGDEGCQQESFEFRDFVNPPLPSSRTGSGDSLSDILQESLITQFDQTASDSNAGDEGCQSELPQDLRDFVNQPPTSSVTAIPPELSSTAMPETILTHLSHPWRCDKCGAEFNDWVSYDSHAKEHTG